MGCVSKQGLKKASFINVHLFIAEVEAEAQEERWVPAPTGSCMVRIF